uniref:G domain-containing protein n=1 Tax=Chenopodium quinoa TaxID=63459 RepID=A0A803N7N0_CHEQI
MSWASEASVWWFVRPGWCGNVGGVTCNVWAATSSHVECLCFCAGNSDREFYKELVKVIEASDVIWKSLILVIPLIKKSMTVGIVGLPNVGKSSFINSLKRSHVAKVGATPGLTRSFQGVQLDKNVKLMDCIGVVMRKSGQKYGYFKSCSIVITPPLVTKGSPPTQPLTKYVEVIGIAESNQSVRADIMTNFGDNFDALQSFIKKSASIFGLTRGKVQVHQREPLASKPKSFKNAGDSVVYFDSTGAVSTTGISSSSRLKVISSSVVASTGESIAASSSEKFVSSPASESVNQPDLNAHVGAKSAADQVMGVGEFQTANTPTSASSTTIPLKRRKPWERKVPATLFSRAQLIRL